MGTEKRGLESAVLAEAIATFRELQTKYTEGWDRVTANLVNDVISSGLHLIGPNGYWYDGFNVPYGSLFIVNHSDTDMIVTSGTPISSTAPSLGTGVRLVPANSSAVVNQTGTAYTVYGVVGDFVSVEIYSKSQPPIASLVKNDLNTASMATVTTGTAPAAGAEWSQTVPTGESWQLNTIRFSLVTSVVVANRLASITFDNGTATILGRFPSTQTEPASTTNSYTASVDIASSGLLGTEILVSLPRMQLPGGFRIRSLTTAIDVADQYSAPVFYYTRFA